jgi:hypothetical protein
MMQYFETKGIVASKRLGAHLAPGLGQYPLENASDLSESPRSWCAKVMAVSELAFMLYKLPTIQ